MVRKFIMTLSVGVFAVVSFGSIASAQDCTIAKAGDDNPVAAACKKGGVKEAKKAMKSMVAAAKKNGLKTECTTCHVQSTEDDFKLTSDAQSKFKDLLAKSK
jgi:hypothetical protein